VVAVTGPQVDGSQLVQTHILFDDQIEVAHAGPRFGGVLCPSRPIPERSHAWRWAKASAIDR
jgi:hypothetical protein